MIAPNRTPTLRRRLLWAAGPILVVLVGTMVIVWSGGVLLNGPAVSPLPQTPAAHTPSPTVVPPAATPSPSPAPSAVPSPSPVPSATPRPSPIPTVSFAAADALLDAANTDRYAWPAGALLHPHGLAVLGDTAYTIDAGELVALDLSQAAARRLVPPGGQIEGIPIGELSYLALSPDGAGLLLLDKRGDMYRYDAGTGTWHVERPIDKRRTSPNPVPVAVASYNGRAYILDTTYTQIWRYPYDDVAEGYFEGGVGSRMGTSIATPMYCCTPGAARRPLCPATSARRRRATGPLPRA
jgi:hypothetical protein